MLRRLARISALVGSLAAPACALADTLDLTRATCADFIAMNATDQTQISLWLAGYYAGGAQRPLIDIEKIAAAPAGLAAVCAKTPALPLVGTETRAVFIAPSTP